MEEIFGTESARWVGNDVCVFDMSWTEWTNCERNLGVSVPQLTASSHNHDEKSNRATLPL